MREGQEDKKGRNNYKNVFGDIELRKKKKTNKKRVSFW